MSGSGSRGGLAVGDIVLKEKKRAQIIGGKKGAWTIATYDDDGKLGSPESGVADALLKSAGYRAHASQSGIAPVIEVAINATLYAIIQKFRKSDRTFGPRFMSFAISDAIYELLAKYYVEQYVPFLRPAALLKPAGFFSNGDFMDGLKFIPIVIIQEIVHLFNKHKAFQHLLKNSIDAFSAIVVGNVVGRGVSAKMTKKEGATEVPYRW